MSHDPNPNSFGYLVFTKTRAANVPFFAWLFKDFIFPLVNDQRTGCSFKNTENYLQDSYAVFTFDGEQQQVKACLDDDVLNASKSSSTWLVKLCASCSLIHQLCDVCAIYRAAKCDMKRMVVSDFENVDLEDNIRGAIDENNSVLQLTSEMKSKLITGILKVIRVLKKNVTSDNIISGAKKACLIGNNDEWHETVSKLPFQYCTHKFSAIEAQIVESNWDKLMECFESNGKISDEFMNNLDIPVGAYASNQVLKDDLTEYRWRITCLNHDKVSSELLAKKQEKIAEALAREAAAAQKARINAAKEQMRSHVNDAESYNKTARNLKSKDIKDEKEIIQCHINAKKSNSKSRRFPTISSLRSTVCSLVSSVKSIYSSISDYFKSLEELFNNGNVDESIQICNKISDLTKSIEPLSVDISRHITQANNEFEQLTPGVVVV